MSTRRNAGIATLALALAAGACSSSDDGATVRDLGAEEAEAEGSTSASASSSGSASAPASTGETTLGAADGGYEYASNVDAHRMVVADLCPIGDLLDAGEFDSVATIYTEGGSSVNSDGSVRTIAGFATATERGHGLAEFYGTDTPLDDFITDAFDGTGVFEGLGDGARSQGVEKGMRNQVMVAWLVHELEAALTKAADGNFDIDEGAVHNWDEGWAFYHGVEPGCAPYATGNSRAGNFGTLAADGETAQANEAIEAAMIEGRDALLAEDAEGAQAATDEVMRNLVVIYSQATIRYASVVEGDLADGDDAAAEAHQAEGLAFFRVIEAYVADAGADVDAINAVYDLAAGPGANGFGDEVRAALEPAWASLGIDAADIGELQ